MAARKAAKGATKKTAKPAAKAAKPAAKATKKAAKKAAKPAATKAPKTAAKKAAKTVAKKAAPKAPKAAAKAPAPAKKAAKKGAKPAAPAAPPAPVAPATAEELATRPEALPDFVRDASPAERKAAVEALALDAGVAPILARAPWRRQAPRAEGAAAPGTGVPAPKLKMSTPESAPDTPRVGSGKRPVLLDTNALMMQFQFHIDVEKELRRLLDFGHEIIVPSVVVDELNALAKEARGKDAGEARMALELAKTFRVMDAPGQGDTSLLRLAEHLGDAIVVTNDKLLRARLRAKDIPNIYMRSSAFLTLEGHITGL